MKKFFMLSLMVLAMIFFVSCSNKSDRDEISGKDGNQNSGGADTGDSANDDDTGADTGDSANDEDTDSGDSANDDDTDSGSNTDPEFVADENLFEVPAGQDNTDGAPCDPETFVEFCDSNTVVYCEEEEIYDDEGEPAGYNYFVSKYECEEDDPVCLTYRRNDKGWEHNWAACFSSCETIGKDSECIDEDNFDFWYTEYVCKQTSKGKLLFYGEYIPCNSVCSEDGKTCKMEKCDPETDAPTCDENGVLHWCYESYGYLSAAFCEAYEGVCGYDNDGEAGCFYPDDDDEGEDY